MVNFIKSFKYHFCLGGNNHDNEFELYHFNCKNNCKIRKNLSNPIEKNYHYSYQSLCRSLEEYKKVIRDNINLQNNFYVLSINYKESKNNILRMKEELKNIQEINKSLIIENNNLQIKIEKLEKNLGLLMSGNLEHNE